MSTLLLPLGRPCLGLPTSKSHRVELRVQLSHPCYWVNPVLGSIGVDQSCNLSRQILFLNFRIPFSPFLLLYIYMSQSPTYSLTRSTLFRGRPYSGVDQAFFSWKGLVELNQDWSLIGPVSIERTFVRRKRPFCKRFGKLTAYENASSF